MRIDSFDDSAINLLVYCFTKSAEFGDYLLAKENLVKNIITAVGGAGSSFAFPSRSIYVEAASNASPETFTPATRDKNPEPASMGDPTTDK